MKRVSLKDHLEVERVLMQFAAGDPAALWNIRQIGQGYQAQLFSAQRRKMLVGQPVENEVVVKLYKETVAADRHACLSEKCGLEVLTDLLPSNVCGEWSIRSPALLYASDNPLALVMSSLPGIPLDVWLHSHAPSKAEAVSMVDAILASLQVLWSQGFMYGDLNLKNILYDATQRNLSFIDPGLPAEYYSCAEVAQQWYPMSRDIAYLLFSVAVSVKSTLRNLAARKRQQRFVALLMGRYFESIQTRQQRLSLLDEVRSCIETHLRELDCSWSPSGIWRQLVKRIAHSSLNRTFDQLAVEIQEVPK